MLDSTYLSKKKVIHAKNRKELGVLCLTISVKHFFCRKKVLHAKNREPQNAKAITPSFNCVLFTIFFVLPTVPYLFHVVASCIPLERSLSIGFCIEMPSINVESTLCQLCVLAELFPYTIASIINCACLSSFYISQYPVRQTDHLILHFFISFFYPCAKILISYIFFSL